MGRALGHHRDWRGRPCRRHCRRGQACGWGGAADTGCRNVRASPGAMPRWSDDSCSCGGCWVNPPVRGRHGRAAGLVHSVRAGRGEPRRVGYLGQRRQRARPPRAVRRVRSTPARRRGRPHRAAAAKRGCGRPRRRGGGHRRGGGGGSPRGRPSPRRPRRRRRRARRGRRGRDGAPAAAAEPAARPRRAAAAPAGPSAAADARLAASWPPPWPRRPAPTACGRAGRACARRRPRRWGGAAVVVAAASRTWHRPRRGFYRAPPSVPAALAAAALQNGAAPLWAQQSLACGRRPGGGATWWPLPNTSPSRTCQVRRKRGPRLWNQKKSENRMRWIPARRAAPTSPPLCACR